MQYTNSKGCEREREGGREGGLAHVHIHTCSSAATIYMAKTGRTAPFIVMETDILSNGMPSNRICMATHRVVHIHTYIVHAMYVHTC